jgi:precorrin-2 dehydrogenase / sirohydrochlorin ferrochelatase
MPMEYYPLFLDIRHCRCLVVGAGTVGCRKLEGLLAANPLSVLVLDTAAPSAQALPLLQHPAVTFAQRPFSPQDLEGITLVFAATGNAAVNAGITTLCREKNIFCNCIDAPASGTVIVPAKASSGRLTAALSTGGASPALARLWRQELEAWLAPRAAMASLMGRLRPLVLAMQNDTGHNTHLFRSIAASPLQAALAKGDRAACEALLLQLLPPVLHRHIAELLHDIT